MTPDHAAAARAAFRSEITADSGDGEGPRVWALGHAFDVLDLMSLAGIPIPDEYDYTPAPGLDWPRPDEDASSALLREVWQWTGEEHGARAADDALAYWARVLVRYLHLPAVAALAD